MYPMDRIQQKHARQIDLLENLRRQLFRIIQIQPVSGTKLEKFIFCNTLFHESFLTQDQSAENGFCRREIFCELISVHRDGSIQE